LAVVEGSDAEDRLFAELFETRRYKKTSRPVTDMSDTIHVELGIMLIKIVQVVRIRTNSRH